MNRNGWIMLHRKILENPIVCKDAEYFAVWLYLLLEATHKDIQKVFKGKKIILHPGQLITGRKIIASQFGISESKVQRILKSFELDQQIERQKSNKNSLITIVNWNSYQSDERQNEQQVNDKRTATEHNTINKEFKNTKNSNVSFDQEFEKLWKIYPRKEGKKKARDYYIRSRKKGTTFIQVEKGIQLYINYIQANKVPMQYVKMGSTFFCQECWLDNFQETQLNNEKWGDDLDGLF